MPCAAAWNPRSPAEFGSKALTRQPSVSGHLGWAEDTPTGRLVVRTWERERLLEHT